MKCRLLLKYKMRETVVTQVLLFPTKESAREEAQAQLQAIANTKFSDGAFVVEGPRIERMLGYTNLDSEKGFDFFQKFLKENGILKELEERGIKDGDTVRLYGLEFEYWK